MPRMVILYRHSFRSVLSVSVDKADAISAERDCESGHGGGDKSMTVCT